DLSPATLRASVRAAAEFLARSVKGDGLYRYEIDATTGQDLEGYSWPRHSGATFFLTQAASDLDDRGLKRAAVRAARRLAQRATLHCGKYHCIGDSDRPDLGSSALALLTYVELVETGIGPEFRSEVDELCAFLRSQQRPDGEFMHVYDIPSQKP